MSQTGRQAAGRRSQAGTTLVEALVVVTITALAALIGFPRLQQGILVLSQRQAVSEVASRLRVARAEAELRDGPVAFAVAADGRAFGASGGQTLLTPPGVTLAVSGAGGRIVFYGDGSSTGGQVLVRAARRVTPVTIVQQTGVVMVGGA